MNQDTQNIWKGQHTHSNNGFKLKNLLPKFAKIFIMVRMNLHRKFMRIKTSITLHSLDCQEYIYIVIK